MKCNLKTSVPKMAVEKFYCPVLESLSTDLTAHWFPSPIFSVRFFCLRMNFPSSRGKVLDSF